MYLVCGVTSHKPFPVLSLSCSSDLDPRQAPFLPHSLVGQVARFTFHTLTIPLIYSTIAIAVTVETVGNYWFVFVATFVLIGVSYLVATLLAYVFLDKTTTTTDAHHEYRALMQAVAYPNIVALPILIFPSLCEYPVVYQGYFQSNAPYDDNNVDVATLQRQCIAQSNTMIFCSFFSWSLAFWSVGHRQLMRAAHDRHRDTTNVAMETETNDNNSNVNNINERTIQEQTRKEMDEGMGAGANGVNVVGNEVQKTDENAAIEPSSIEEERNERGRRDEPTDGWWVTFWHALKQTMASPGFMAMTAAFITACIPPLQKALFEGGGSLRFLGSAMETLGNASSPLSTMVVAASLVAPPQQVQGDERSDDMGPDTRRNHHADDVEEFHVIDENPGMTDPNFGPYRRRQRQRRRSSRFQNLRLSMRRVSEGMRKTVPRTSQEMLRLHVWFCTSRLLITPAIIVGLILALDCSGGDWFGTVPNLAKLVVIVNASLPGALIVIVLLKCDERMAETASVVAKVYMPSYFLSIFTITAWTALGLWITLPDEDGQTVCRR